ncbi:MAG TPA: chromosome segregation protein SMC [Streptosporangiaceae bacterium]|nr:chromosome segregation protein SMC [Streptosporangiaceae bacterium]
MYLKNLTLRGFKSFASATTLRLEPGITCVVGPNGSGKSNVVDALSWVMGEQGAKSLRGGKMEDVVFAGTTSRPPLGRAEVTLTIDNSDGALPIDYTEVTISRLMFRSGQSEYAINGDHCRLLDVQDLLSDSGLGREMHVIVGQGQLDDILHAGPEARRALIEEAAGVLKHRKRKEKALRKLEAMQANLTRLVDLTAELSRRLKPLGRQAEVARKAAVIQAELRDARLRLLADDYVTLAADLARDEADEAAVLARRTALELQVAQARARETELDQAAQQASAVLGRAQETWFALSSLTERLRSTQHLAAQRHTLLTEATAEPERPGRDPDELDRQAGELREEEDGLNERLAAGRQVLAAAAAERAAAEAQLATAERRQAEGAKAAAARANRLARLREQVGAAGSRSAAAREEMDRLEVAAAAARERATLAQDQYEDVQELSGGGDEDRSGLAAAHQQAAAELSQYAERVKVLRTADRESARDLAARRARAEALAEAARRGVDASGALLADPVRYSGVIGSFAARLRVAEGFEVAIAAALGAAAEAVAVADLDAAADILATLRGTDTGSAGLVVAQTPATPAPSDFAVPSVPPVPAGTAIPATELVRAPGGLAEAASELLHDVVVVADLGEARRFVRENPGRRAVTRDGDLLGAFWAQGGGARPQSLFEMRAAADEAAAGLAEAEQRCEEAAEGLAAAAEAEEAAREVVAQALARRHEADAAAAEVSGRLGRLAGAARAARDEADRLEASITSARLAAEKDLSRLEQLRHELAEAETAAEEPDEPLHDEAREDLAERCVAARNAEMEARLEVRTAEERLRAISGRADSLSATAAAERATRQRAAERRRRQAQQAAVARAVALGARYAVEAAEQSVNLALARRAEAEAASASGAAELKVVRARVRELAADLDTVVNTAHGTEIARAEHRLRLQQLAEHALEEFGVEADALVAEYGPELPVPVIGDQNAVPSKFERAAAERRAADASKQLDRLGKVNPLALEEYEALTERHNFLATQLEDLRKTRRDLLTVVKEVDDRVQEVFASAYADTAREFEHLFGRLFPGGQGNLVLTEPDDMLATGIEIEARPPGKKVKRLSLLSGGERSLTAIAYLFAIFKARPSPFYVLDEVEAALDDTNLQRLLLIFDELRESSQLIVITHQRRTMEAADALYGITMRGDGVSAVISQQLATRQPA